MDDFVESDQHLDFERMSFYSLVHCMASLSDTATETGIAKEFQDFMTCQRALFNNRANGTYKDAKPLMRSHHMTKYLVQAGSIFLQLYEEPGLLEEKLQDLYSQQQNPKPF